MLLAATAAWEDARIICNEIQMSDLPKGIKRLAEPGPQCFHSVALELGRCDETINHVSSQIPTGAKHPGVRLIHDLASERKRATGRKRPSREAGGGLRTHSNST